MDNFNNTPSSGSGNSFEKKRTRNKEKSRFFTARNMTMLAFMSAMAVVLYNWGAIRAVPGFPPFLSMELSDIPILLAGFMLGPVGGAVVVLVRFLLKLPMTSTMGVGEVADVILGLTFVITASSIYRVKRTKKGVLIGLGAGIVATTIMAVIVNRFILVPFFVYVMFDGNWNILLNMVRPLYSGVTRQNFFTYYLLLATIPFNLIRLIACAIITLGLYDRLGWLIEKKRKEERIEKKE
ncbi:MAG: ECF transporter S component [Firmicutes bacterium]|nr:ECF transporter S component [Bacillota bacterium]